MMYYSTRVHYDRILNVITFKAPFFLVNIASSKSFYKINVCFMLNLY